MGRVILHIDLNAFFARAEVLLDPSLEGKPIAVSGNTRRSVVSTCSYEARAFGVHSAMPISEAERLCKDLIIVNGHYDYYEELSRKFMALIYEYTPLVEQASIDECYADVTDIISRYPKPLDLPVEIQRNIYQKLKLKCSIGVAPNKFLAKMASDMQKPMGITILRISEVESKLWPLPIKDMRGVGTKTLKHMEDLNIQTIGDLANYDDMIQLRKVFGKNTDSILARVHGHDDSELICTWDAKSLSQSSTFLEDITDYSEIKGGFTWLARKLAHRLVEEGKMGKIITITIKYYDFRSIVRSAKLEKPIYRSEDLLEHALELFDANWNDEPVRLLGIGVQQLVSVKEYKKQLDLFSELDDFDKTLDVLHELNSQLSIPGLILASDLVGKGKHED